jgi:hypothetical protein
MSEEPPEPPPPPAGARGAERCVESRVGCSRRAGCGLGCVACVWSVYDSCVWPCVACVWPVCGLCADCSSSVRLVHGRALHRETADSARGKCRGNTMLKADRVSTRAPPLQPHKGAASAASRCAMNPGNVSSAAVAGMGEKG